MGPVPAGAIGLTLATWLIVYAVLTAAYISVVFLLARRAGRAVDERPGVNALRSTGRTAGRSRYEYPKVPELIPDLTTQAGWLPLAFMAMMGIAILAYVIWMATTSVSAFCCRWRRTTRKT